MWIENMDRWPHLFSQHDLPGFVCPHCRHGKLLLMRDTFNREESSYSKVNREADGFYPGDAVQRFACLLRCSRQTCGDVVAMAGTIEDVEVVYQGNHASEEALRPRAILPAPPLIQVPESAPESVRNAIKSADALYWMDIDSCANKLRVAVENLLSHFGIPRYNQPKKGKKRTPLNLSSRIAKFEGLRSGHQTTFDALRWVGNEGSHGGKQEVDLKVLHRSYELLEYALAELIDKRTTELSKDAAELVRSKGRRLAK